MLDKKNPNLPNLQELSYEQLLSTRGDLVVDLIKVNREIIDRNQFFLDKAKEMSEEAEAENWKVIFGDALNRDMGFDNTLTAYLLEIARP